MVAQTCTLIQILVAGEAPTKIISNFLDVVSGHFATPNPEVKISLFISPEIKVTFEPSTSEFVNDEMW